MVRLYSSPVTFRDMSNLFLIGGRHKTSTSVVVACSCLQRLLLRLSNAPDKETNSSAQYGYIRDEVIVSHHVSWYRHQRICACCVILMAKSALLAVWILNEAITHQHVDDCVTGCFGQQKKADRVFRCDKEKRHARKRGVKSGCLASDPFIPDAASGVVGFFAVDVSFANSSIVAKAH